MIHKTSLAVGVFIALINQASLAQPIQINCTNGDTITQVLTNAQPGDTIQITGTCEERVMITTDRLTLEGQGSAIIDGRGDFEVVIDGSEGVITVDGAQGIVIEGITVQNGPTGISGRRGAAMTLRNIRARGNADDGIKVTQNATAQIIDCTAEDNGDDGFAVSTASSAQFRGTITSLGNGDDGISILFSSSGGFFEATVMANNNGQSATFGGQESSGFIVGDGIRVTDSSHLFVGPNSTVQANNNADDGIAVARTSTFTAFGVPEQGPVTITAEGNGQLNESGDGVVASLSSSFTLSGALATLNVANNARRGILISSDSSSSFSRATVRPGTPVTPEALQNRSFTFSDGAAFGLSGQQVFLRFGEFGGVNTGSFALSTSNATASGTATIASCTFTVMTSDFPSGSGPQASEVILIEPCEMDPLDRLFAMNSSTGAISVSF